LLIPQKIRVNITANKSSSLFKLLEKNNDYIGEMAGVYKILELPKKIPPSAIILIGKEKIYLPLEGLIDVQSEKDRSQKNLEKLTKSTQSLESQLRNEKFIKNAPKSLIKDRKNQLKESSEKIKKLNDHLKILELI
jgi:valyl-tRNA synthetase